jgi:hypothetical protein
MKTKFTLSVVFTLFMSVMFAQNRTIVTANSADISDQLDLRAVATLFGESRNLETFERNLNDPNLMISNLDLNGDNYVDYLRVIEHRQRNTHLVIIQAVLDRDVVQDVATIEVESNRRRRNAQVQIVGNPYIYGNNFIIEPVFAYTPVIYNYFWQPTYTLWVSPWNWGFYPVYFNAWHPLDMHFYYGHVNYWAGYHHFNYMSYRRFNRAMMMYNRHHVNTFATMYPNRSFVNRNQNFRNAHALADSRGNRDFRQVSPREESAINGRERIANNRIDGGRTSTGRENVSTDRQTTSGREVNAGGRENNTSSGREIQTSGREINTQNRPTSGREVVNNKPVESNTRPIQNDRNERAIIERPATRPAESSINTTPQRQINTNRESAPTRVATPARTNNTSTSSSNVNRQQAPTRVATPATNRGSENSSNVNRQQAPARVATPTTNRGSERSSSSTSSGRSTQSGGRG